MSELTAEEQKYFETGGNAEIPATEEVKTEVSEVKAEEIKAEPPKEEKTVPYGALHEERQLRKEAQRQLQETAARMKEFEGLKEQLAEWRREKQAQQAQAQAEQDPLGYMQGQISTLSKQIEQTQTQTREQQQQQEQQRQFLHTVNSQVTAFTRTQPDYPKALQFVVEQRMKEYEAMGVADPAERQALFDQEAVNIAQHALQRGVNPAEAVWNMAQARGFKLQPAQNPADEKLDRIKRGMQQAKSVGTAGSAPESDLSLTDIENMSDTEFDKLWADMEKSA